MYSLFCHITVRFALFSEWSSYNDDMPAVTFAQKYCRFPGTTKPVMAVTSLQAANPNYPTYTQRHKLRTAYSTNDCRGKWVAIS